MLFEEYKADHICLFRSVYKGNNTPLEKASSLMKCFQGYRNTGVEFLRCMSHRAKMKFCKTHVNAYKYETTLPGHFCYFLNNQVFLELILLQLLYYNMITFNHTLNTFTDPPQVLLQNQKWLVTSSCHLANGLFAAVILA